MVSYYKSSIKYLKANRRSRFKRLLAKIRSQDLTLSLFTRMSVLLRDSPLLGGVLGKRQIFLKHSDIGVFKFKLKYTNLVKATALKLIALTKKRWL